ncbi:MAG TPA: oligosaccharide flippase family protein [Allosphingosinicella sp.]|nr:oligosaccharide flippase family protein [Allosphingosinicella sp.]
MSGSGTFDRATIYRSAATAVALQWSVRAIGLVSVIVMARLLQPHDFGIVALALAVSAFVELFGYIGLRQALLRIPAPERSHYDTAFTIQLALFLVLALLMCGLAPLAARFYGEPAVAPILWAMAVRVAALGFINIGIVEFEREMQFGRDMKMRLSVRVASLLVSLAAALVLRNYWALVIGLVAYSLFYMVASYLAHPFRPRLDLSRRAELLGVSLWMFVSSFAEFVQTQIERLVLGRFFAPTTVGLYSVSKDLSVIFTQEITTALNRVTFVTVSSGQTDAGVGRNIARVIGGYAAVVAPLSAGLVATAPDAITVLLGAQWLPAAPLLRIIALYAGVQAVYLMTASVLQASGFVRRAALMNLGGAFLSAAALIGAAWQWQRPEAIAYAALAVDCVMLAVGLTLLARNAQVPVLPLAANLVRPLLAAAAMVAMLWGPEKVETGSPFLDLVCAVCLGGVTYAGCLALLWLAAGRPDGAEREAAMLIGSLRRRLRAG